MSMIEPEGSSGLRVQTIQLRMDYVLILEWLDAIDKDRTGSDLHEYLQTLGLPSVLVQCNAASDIEQAIAAATQNVGTKGVPAVHIESHGDDPMRTPIESVKFGASAVHGISWYKLGDWLAPLNVAANFRLPVVGATCNGLGVMAAMKIFDHVAPFAACVGFTTGVMPGSVREAMCELYRSVSKGVALHDAVESAAREVRRPGEKLQAEGATQLAMQVLRGARQRVLRGHFPESYEQFGPRAFQAAWDCWFPPALQLANSAYRLDWSLVEA